jgi:D-proline reductase (dithiol) PrdB
MMPVFSGLATGKERGPNMSGRWKNRLIARIITRFPSLSRRVVEAYSPRESKDIPWVPVTKPLYACTLALVTTAGVHRRDQQPYDMNDRDGDPTFREIPVDTPPDELMITHDYYDHTDADRDINIVFPLERIEEFASEGIIGGVARAHYALMGHITGRHLFTLMQVSAPEVASRLKDQGADIVLLTPG